MGQLSVPNQNAEAAGIEISSMYARDAIDDAGQTESIVRPSPPLARQREAGRHRPVGVGEFVRLDVTVSPAGTSEQTKVRGNLLLHAQADTAPAAKAWTNKLPRAYCHLWHIDPVSETAHPPPA